jgi:hypothetical protein
MRYVDMRSENGKQTWQLKSASAVVPGGKRASGWSVVACLRDICWWLCVGGVDCVCAQRGSSDGSTPDSGWCGAERTSAPGEPFR